MVTSSLPKNEEIGIRYNDTENGKVYINTQNVLDGKFHLYEEKDGNYIHLRQRSNNPFFKETNPERYT